jgi:hypothetical protein
MVLRARSPSRRRARTRRALAGDLIGDHRTYAERTAGRIDARVDHGDLARDLPGRESVSTLTWPSAMKRACRSGTVKSSLIVRRRRG